MELVPLPEGVPEVLPITCNGRSGVLLVRTQRVQHSQAEMSASKFEQVCGKGDAKKWKSSIWVEAPDGSQIMVLASTVMGIACVTACVCMAGAVEALPIVQITALSMSYMS